MTSAPSFSCSSQRQHFRVVASPDFIRQNGEPLVPNDLTNMRCIYSKTLNGNNQWVFRKDGVEQIITIEKTFELSASKMITKGALQGAGIAYLPEFLVKKHIKSGDLVELLDRGGLLSIHRLVGRWKFSLWVNK